MPPQRTMSLTTSLGQSASLSSTPRTGQAVRHPALLQGLSDGAKGGAPCKRGSRICNQIEQEGESQKPGL
jgi:hypothetical protein